MADDTGIGDIFRIVGIRNIGRPGVFPRTRIVRKKKKKPEEESVTGEQEKGETPGSPENHAVDIEA